MQCAEDTQCTPSGLSYDFAVEYQGGGNGASTSGTSSLAITGLLLATVVVSFVVHW